MSNIFDNLLSSSRKLNRDLLSKLDIPNEFAFKRPASELANADGVGLRRVHFEERKELDAVRLLAEHKFHLPHFAANVKDMRVEAHHDPMGVLEVTDLDGYLDHHHQMIARTAIEESKKGADETVQKMQKGWVEEDWNKSRAMFFESLGFRSRIPKKESKLQNQLSIASGSNGLPSIQTSASLDFLHKYAEVVESHVTSEGKQASTKKNIFKEFKDHVGVGASRDKRYSKSLELLSVMCGETDRGLDTPPRDSDPQLFLIHGTNVPSAIAHQFLTLGAVRFFENIQKEYCLKKGGSQFLLATNPRVTVDFKVQCVEKFLTGKGEGRNDWASVYYLLSFGEVQLACQALEKICGAGMGASVGAGAVKTVLEFFERHKKWVSQLAYEGGGGPNNKEGPDKNAISSLKTAREECQRLYANDRKEADNRKSSGSPYRTFLCNLLSETVDDFGINDPDISDYKLDDFLWANAWVISFNRFVNFVTVGKVEHARGPGEIDFFGRMSAFGAAHFDPDGTHPYLYADVLIVCHRFGDAIKYLWENGEPVAALHIAIGCVNYGLILPHVPLVCNSPTLLIGSSRQVHSLGELSPLGMIKTILFNSSDAFIRERVVFYLMMLKPHGVVDLGLEDREFAVEVAAESRLPGAYTLSKLRQTLESLDFEPSQVDNMFRQAAQALVDEDRGEGRRAVSLFEHAKEFDLALKEVCRQLSKLATAPSTHAEKVGWKRVADSFFKNIFEEKNWFIRDSRLKRDFGLLVQITDVFDDDDPQSASRKLRDIELIPHTKTPAAVAAAVRLVQDCTYTLCFEDPRDRGSPFEPHHGTTTTTTPYILHVLDDFILRAMHIILGEYEYVDRTNRLPSRRADIEAVHDRASALFDFAIALNKLSLCRLDTTQKVKKLME